MRYRGGQRPFIECQFSDKQHSKRFPALTNLVNGKNVFAILPTGFGKSLIFQLFPHVMSAVNEKDDAVSTIIVISPLVAIRKDQVEQLQSN